MRPEPVAPATYSRLAGLAAPQENPPLAVRPTRSTTAEPNNEQASLMAEMENEELHRQIVELRRMIDDLHAEADLDGCHIVGLTAQIKALLAANEACPNKAAHRLVEPAEYVDSRTGQTITKTRALSLYREAFDAEAIKNPELHRS